MVEGFTVWSGLMSAVRGKEGALDLDRPLSRQRGADQFSGKGPLKKKARRDARPYKAARRALFPV